MAETVIKTATSSNDAASSSRAVEDDVLRTPPGSRVCFRLANSNPQDLEGLLYSACARTRIVVVATGVVPSLVYHIISTTNILSFNVTRTPTDPLSISNSTSIDHKAQIARANAALYKAKESARKINRNVDRPTQDLFGAIDKQFSARWQGMDIVVMERVVVKSPGYSTEDCKVITKDGEGLLARVRKVLEHERRRAAQRDVWKPVKPAVPNIMPAVPVSRKGG